MTDWPDHMAPLHDLATASDALTAGRPTYHDAAPWPAHALEPGDVIVLPLNAGAVEAAQVETFHGGHLRDMHHWLPDAIRRQIEAGAVRDQWTAVRSPWGSWTAWPADMTLSVRKMVRPVNGTSRPAEVPQDEPAAPGVPDDPLDALDALLGAVDDVSHAWDDHAYHDHDTGPDPDMAERIGVLRIARARLRATRATTGYRVVTLPPEDGAEDGDTLTAATWRLVRDARALLDRLPAADDRPSPPTAFAALADVSAGIHLAFGRTMLAGACNSLERYLAIPTTEAHR